MTVGTPSASVQGSPERTISRTLESFASGARPGVATVLLRDRGESHLAEKIHKRRLPRDVPWQASRSAPPDSNSNDRVNFRRTTRSFQLDSASSDLALLAFGSQAPVTVAAVQRAGVSAPAIALSLAVNPAHQPSLAARPGDRPETSASTMAGAGRGLCRAGRKKGSRWPAAGWLTRPGCSGPGLTGIWQAEWLDTRPA